MTDPAIISNPFLPPNLSILIANESVQLGLKETSSIPLLHLYVQFSLT